MNLTKMLEGKSLKILNYFIDRPSREVTRGQVAKDIGLAKATAVKYFDLLVKKGILVEKEIGRNKLLKLNNDSILVRELKRLFILQQFDGFRIKNAEAYLFGSSARGEYLESSDIDLLIIGKVHRNEIIEKIEKIEKKIKRKINVQIFTPQDWSMMAKKDPAFYERVEKDKIKLS